MHPEVNIRVPEAAWVRQANKDFFRVPAALEYELEGMQKYVGSFAYLGAICMYPTNIGITHHTLKYGLRTPFHARAYLGACDVVRDERVGGYIAGVRIGGFEDLTLVHEADIESQHAAVDTAYTIAQGSVFVPFLAMTEFEIER